jgi:hypothetical protein
MRELDGKGLLKRNLKNPPLKDTVHLPANGYTIIRFFANNPGVWPLHCHNAMVVFQLDLVNLLLYIVFYLILSIRNLVK